MPTLYPFDYDSFVYAKPPDLACAILKIESRVGKRLETAPDSIEDRLYTIENLEVGGTHPDLTAHVLMGLAPATDLAGKAPVVHGHAISEVANLQGVLDGKASSSHSHAQLHDRQHSITSGSDHSFPGDGTMFLAGDGTFKTPTAASEYVLKARASADVTNATVTLANVPGLAFSYLANSTYCVDLYLLCTSVAATTGYSFALDVSTAVTSVGVTFNHQLANAGTLSGGQSIADATRTGLSSGVPTAGALTPVFGGGVLVTGATAGTAQLQFAPEVAASATCKAGSVMRVMKVA